MEFTKHLQSTHPTAPVDIAVSSPGNVVGTHSVPNTSSSMSGFSANKNVHTLPTTCGTSMNEGAQCTDMNTIMQRSTTPASILRNYQYPNGRSASNFWSGSQDSLKSSTSSSSIERRDTQSTKRNNAPAKSKASTEKLPRRRRSSAELMKTVACQAIGCDKVYASKHALSLHMKLKHQNDVQVLNECIGEQCASPTVEGHAAKAQHPMSEKAKNKTNQLTNRKPSNGRSTIAKDVPSHLKSMRRPKMQVADLFDMGNDQLMRDAETMSIDWSEDCKRPPLSSNSVGFLDLNLDLSTFASDLQMQNGNQLETAAGCNLSVQQSTSGTPNVYSPAARAGLSSDCTSEESDCVDGAVSANHLDPMYAGMPVAHTWMNPGTTIASAHRLGLYYDVNDSYDTASHPQAIANAQYVQAQAYAKADADAREKAAAKLSTREQARIERHKIMTNRNQQVLQQMYSMTNATLPAIYAEAMAPVYSDEGNPKTKNIPISPAPPKNPPVYIMTQAQAQAHAYAQAHAQAHMQAQVNQAHAQAHAQQQAQIQAEVQAHVHAQQQAKIHAEAHAQQQAEAHAQTQAQAQAQAHAQAQAQAQMHEHNQVQAQVRAYQQTQISANCASHDSFMSWLPQSPYSAQSPQKATKSKVKAPKTKDAGKTTFSRKESLDNPTSALGKRGRSATTGAQAQGRSKKGTSTPLDRKLSLQHAAGLGATHQHCPDIGETTITHNSPMSLHKRQRLPRSRSSLSHSEGSNLATHSLSMLPRMTPQPTGSEDGNSVNKCEGHNSGNSLQATSQYTLGRAESMHTPDTISSHTDNDAMQVDSTSSQGLSASFGALHSGDFGFDGLNINMNQNSASANLATAAVAGVVEAGPLSGMTIPSSLDNFRMDAEVDSLLGLTTLNTGAFPTLNKLSTMSTLSTGGCTTGTSCSDFQDSTDDLTHTQYLSGSNQVGPQPLVSPKDLDLDFDLGLGGLGDLDAVFSSYGDEFKLDLSNSVGSPSTLGTIEETSRDSAYGDSTKETAKKHVSAPITDNTTLLQKMCLTGLGSPKTGEARNIPQRSMSVGPSTTSSGCDDQGQVSTPRGMHTIDEYAKQIDSTSLEFSADFLPPIENLYASDEFLQMHADTTTATHTEEPTKYQFSKETHTTTEVLDTSDSSVHAKSMRSKSMGCPPSSPLRNNGLPQLHIEGSSGDIMQGSGVSPQAVHPTTANSLRKTASINTAMRNVTLNN